MRSASSPRPGPAWITCRSLLVLPLFAVAALAAVAAWAQPPEEGRKKQAEDAAEKPVAPFRTMKQQRSYAIGVNIARSIRNDQLELDMETVFKGIRDALADGKLLLDDEQIDATLIGIQQQMLQKRQQLAEANLKTGRDFLEENSKKPDVVTVRSGLQYRVIKAGKGPSPDFNDRVRVHYTGKLLDGSEFDSSYKRDQQPALLAVDMVIPGWTEALQRMRVGDKWQLFVPPELGYGAEGLANLIGPNELLVFEIELLGVEEVKEEDTDK